MNKILIIFSLFLKYQFLFVYLRNNTKASVYDTMLWKHFGIVKVLNIGYRI